MNCGEKTKKDQRFGCDPTRFQEMFQKMAECCPPECRTMMETMMGKYGTGAKQETDTKPEKEATPGT